LAGSWAHSSACFANTKYFTRLVFFDAFDDGQTQPACEPESTASRGVVDFSRHFLEPFLALSLSVCSSAFFAAALRRTPG
jgi:hypothetical protein